VRAKLTLILLLGMGTCATAGREVDSRAMEQFRPGVTMYSDPIATRGPPTGQVMMFGGGRGNVYSYVPAQVRRASFIPIMGLLAGGSDVRSSAVSYRFGPDGKLLDSGSSQTSASAGVLPGAPAA